MQTNSKMAGTESPDAAHSAHPAADLTIGDIGPAPAPADRSDKGLVSDVVRALAAHDGDSLDRRLDPARAAEVRSRILGGAYDTIEVVDAVARRLLMSGDL